MDVRYSMPAFYSRLPANRVSPAQMRAIYAAVVMGLTVFVALAFLFPQPIQSYRSRAAIDQFAEARSENLEDAPLLTRSSLERIAEEVFLAKMNLTGAGDNASQQSQAFMESVVCDVENSTGNDVRATVEVRDRYAARSLDICQHMVDAIVERQATSFVPGLAALRSQRTDVEQRLALIRESKRGLEDQLTALEREHVTDLAASLQRIVAAQSALAAGGSSGELPLQYEELDAEFQRLLLQRNTLSRTKTDQHPQMKDLDERLAEVRQRLERLGPVSAAGNGKSGALAKLDELRAEFRRQSAEISEAIANARRREEDLSSEAARLAATPAAVRLVTRVAEPAEVIDRVGGQPSFTRVFLLMLLALTAGCAVYVVTRRYVDERRLFTLDEVNSQLGVPVVTLVGRAPIPPAMQWDSVMRRSLLAAEIALLLLALAGFSVVASQSQLTRSVSADPFGAVAESWDRTLAPTLQTRRLESSTIRR